MKYMDFYDWIAAGVITILVVAFVFVIAVKTKEAKEHPCLEYETVEIPTTQVFCHKIGESTICNSVPTTIKQKNCVKWAE